MTPSAAAALLRAHADAVLASDEHVELTVKVRTLGVQISMTPTERSAKKRASGRLAGHIERAENSTDQGDGAQPPLTLPSEHQEVGSLGKDLGNKGISGEKQGTTLLVSTGARAGYGSPEHAERAENETARGLVQPPGRTSKAARRSSVWRRVPEDWTVKDAHRTLALQLIVDVELEAAKFRDHEFAKPRSDADAAFRNWLREAANRPRANLSGPAALVARASQAIAEERAARANGQHVPQMKKGLFG